MSIEVSDHAVVRFVERFLDRPCVSLRQNNMNDTQILSVLEHEGFKVEVIRENISKSLPYNVNNFSNGKEIKIPLSNSSAVAVIVNDVVVTVLNGRAGRHMLPRKGWIVK